MEVDFATLFCIGIALSVGPLIYFVSKTAMKSSSYDALKESKRRKKNQSNSSDDVDDAKQDKKIKKKSKKKGKENVTACSFKNFVESKTNEVLSSPSTNISQSSFVEHQNDELPSTNVDNRINSSKSDHSDKKESVSINNPNQSCGNIAVIQISGKAELKIDPSTANEHNASNESHDEDSGLSNASSKSKKKPKKNKGDGPGKFRNLSLQNLLPLLKHTEFSLPEIQILIDFLLNKNDSEWSKGKHNPVLKLKKQLVELEKYHINDTDTINALQAKLVSLRSELNTEKRNCKVFREALTKANSDIKSLLLKHHQSFEEKESLPMNIQQLKEQVNQEHTMVIKLQEKLLFLQLNVPQEEHNETVSALQNQVNQLAAKLADEKILNGNLSAQLEESLRVKEDYRQVIALNIKLDHLLSHSRFEVNRLNTELVSLFKQLEDSKTQVNDLRTIIGDIEAKKNELESDNNYLKVEISKANHDTINYQKRSDSLGLKKLEENNKTVTHTYLSLSF